MGITGPPGASDAKSQGALSLHLIGRKPQSLQNTPQPHLGNKHCRVTGHILPKCWRRKDKSQKDLIQAKADYQSGVWGWAGHAALLALN